MLTPTDAMRSFLSGSWMENELEGTIRQLAGSESQSGQGEAGAAEEEGSASITPAEAMNAVTVEGDALLADMHAAAMTFPFRFDKFMNNMKHNRMPHLYCYDHSRVVVPQTHGDGDYYHASFVDGYNKKSAYIFAQAPFDDVTERVFWRMVVDQKPSMILVFGVIDEKQKRKQECNIADKGFEKTFFQEFGASSLADAELKARISRQFWPEKGGSKDYEKISISTTDEHSESHMKTYNLKVSEGKSDRPAVLMHFHEWGAGAKPGDKVEVEELPEYMLDMRASIKVQYVRSSKKAGAFTGPIMLVCATGIAKCANYATIDIVVSRMTGEHTVGFKETMSAIKAQRFGCFSTHGPYATARQMLMKFAVSTGVVHDTAIGDKPKSKIQSTKTKKTEALGFKQRITKLGKK